MFLDVVCVFLPVLGAFLVHAPVLRWDLAPSLKRALDGGATFRGRRVFGDNKTWRGAVAMAGGIVLLTVVLSWLPAYWQRVPPALRALGALPFGALLGLGTVLAELPNSFLKRQLDIAPGSQRRSPLGVALSLFDQGDFVIGIWLILLPIWPMSFAQGLAAFGLVVAVHLLLNVVGYAIGVRTSRL